jgi:hypothetical protein
MNEDILELPPSNLPVYVYNLEADVALVLDKIAYKIRHYSFTSIRVASNQPLKPGDVLTSNSCYFGNNNTQLIPHLNKKRILGGAEIELKYYYGCLIDKLAISYVDPNSEFKSLKRYESCGDGKCTVFIELSIGDTSEKYRILNEREDSLSLEERLEYQLCEQEFFKKHDLAYWQNRIPDWDERLERIGDIPENLIY